MEFLDEIMFVGLDIPKATKKLLDQAGADICKNMTPNEKKAYDFGVKTTMQALVGLISAQEDNEVCVYIPGKEIGEEMDYDELSKLILG